MLHKSALRRLCGAVAAAFLAIQAVGVAQAAEGYAVFAQRLLTHPPAGASIAPDIEATILAATNAYRASKGLPALKPAPAHLRMAARAQAMDLLQSASMGHTSSNGYGFASRMRALQPGNMVLPVMAENAARQRKPGLSDGQKARDIVQQWINSGGHRRNLANRSYVTIAVGAVKRGEDVYAVQIFAGPAVKTNMFFNDAQ